MSKLEIKTAHLFHDHETGSDAWIAEVGGEFFGCTVSDDDSVIIERVKMTRVPPTIFDALIATLIAHPEMQRITHDGGQS